MAAEAEILSSRSVPRRIVFTRHPGTGWIWPSQLATPEAMVEVGSTVPKAVFPAFGTVRFKEVDIHQTERHWEYGLVPAFSTKSACPRICPTCGWILWQWRFLDAAGHAEVQFSCNANPQHVQHGYSTAIGDPRYDSEDPTLEKRFKDWIEPTLVVNKSLSDEKVMTFDGFVALLARVAAGQPLWGMVIETKPGVWRQQLAALPSPSPAAQRLRSVSLDGVARLGGFLGGLWLSLSRQLRCQVHDGERPSSFHAGGKVPQELEEEDLHTERYWIHHDRLERAWHPWQRPLCSFFEGALPAVVALAGGSLWVEVHVKLRGNWAEFGLLWGQHRQSHAPTEQLWCKDRLQPAEHIGISEIGNEVLFADQSHSSWKQSGRRLVKSLIILQQLFASAADSSIFSCKTKIFCPTIWTDDGQGVPQCISSPLTLSFCWSQLYLVVCCWGPWVLELLCFFLRIQTTKLWDFPQRKSVQKGEAEALYGASGMPAGKAGLFLSCGTGLAGGWAQQSFLGYTKQPLSYQSTSHTFFEAFNSIIQYLVEKCWKGFQTARITSWLTTIFLESQDSGFCACDAPDWKQTPCKAERQRSELRKQKTDQKRPAKFVKKNGVHYGGLIPWLVAIHGYSGFF